MLLAQVEIPAEFGMPDWAPTALAIAGIVVAGGALIVLINNIRRR